MGQVDLVVAQGLMARSPEINPHMSGQMIFNKDAKTTQWEKGSLFNTWCWESGHPHAIA